MTPSSPRGSRTSRGTENRCATRATSTGRFSRSATARSPASSAPGRQQNLGEHRSSRRRCRLPQAGRAARRRRLAQGDRAGRGRRRQNRRAHAGADARDAGASLGARRFRLRHAGPRRRPDFAVRHAGAARAWLPKTRSGKAIAAFALTEAASGSDVANITTAARRDGDGLRHRRREELDLQRRHRRSLCRLRPHRRGARRARAFRLHRRRQQSRPRRSPSAST